MAASSPSPLNPNAPEFSPAPLLYPAPFFSYHPVAYYCNPFLPFSGKPLDPSTGDISGEENPRRSFRRPPFGFRFVPPRLKESKFPVDDEITIRLAGKTSLMMKNIPNSFTRKDLLKILDDHCRGKNIRARFVSDHIRSSYDFFYLPMDFVRANLGYAFVNFTSSVAAVRFCRDFDKLQWQVPGKKKTCEITLARFQGKEELSRHFSSSRFTCHTDAYLPVVLSPPSDGFLRYRLTLLGSRIGRACIPPPSFRRE